jgi:hypothetical protein
VKWRLGVARGSRKPDPDHHAGNDCSEAAHEPQTIRQAGLAVNPPSRHEFRPERATSREESACRGVIRF